MGINKKIGGFLPQKQDCVKNKLGNGVDMAKAKKNISLILTVIVGMAIFICAAYNKRVTFCDEIYTYMIVDSGNAAYQLGTGAVVSAGAD